MEGNKIAVNNKGIGVEDALQEAERFARTMDLDYQETLRLRLLAEEMMGVVKAIVGDFSAFFWAEGEKKDVSLHLKAFASVDFAKRGELLSVSSTGKNIAAKGIMGKIREVIENCLYTYQETEQFISKSGVGWAPYDEYGVMNAGMDWSSHYWSLQQYKNTVEESRTKTHEAEEAWDELEKSIVAKLADDVLVGVRDDCVEMIIRKKF